MKTMIYSLTLAALMITSFSSCSDDNDPVCEISFRTGHSDVDPSCSGSRYHR